MLLPLYDITLFYCLYTPYAQLESCLLSNNVYDYRIVSQGKTTIPSVDDGAEFEDTDVRIGNSKYVYTIYY